MLLAVLGAASCTKEISLPTVGQGPGTASEGPRAEPVDSTVATDAGDGSSRCVPVAIGHVQEKGGVLIVLDRSSSMSGVKFGSYTSRTKAVESVLLPLLWRHHHALNFGVQEFPARCPGGACCADAVAVGPSDDAIPAIERIVGCQDRGTTCTASTDDSPSYEALRRAVEFYERAPPAAGSRDVLLVTDGEPACAAAGDARAACDRAVRSVAVLAGMKVGTLVLGLSEELRSGGCLDTMAAVGGSRPPSGPAHRTAADENQLRQQLNELLARPSAGACRFRLSPPADSAEGLSIRFDGMPVLRDPARQDGWELDGSTSRIAVHGPWCERLRTSPVAIQISGCRSGEGRTPEPP